MLHRIGDIYAERSERGAADMELLSVTMNDGVMQRSEIEGKDNSSEDKSSYKVVRKGDMSITPCVCGKEQMVFPLMTALSVLHIPFLQLSYLICN